MSLLNRFEILVGLRYLRAKRKQHFISFISFASVVGIVLGVAVLITVTSVFNGFAKEFHERWLAGTPHVRLMNDAGLQNWRTVLAEANKLPGVVGATPNVNGHGLITSSGVQPSGILLIGISPELESKVTDISSALKVGKLSDLQAGEFGIFVGSAVARRMQLQVGDKLTVITPEGNVTPMGMTPRLKQFNVRGIFNFGHNELDSNLAYIHIADAQMLYRLGDSVSGVRIKLANPDDAPQTRLALQVAAQRAGVTEGYLSDWTRDNAQYFRAVKTEKRMVSLILLLIIAIAAFNLVSSLVMTVTDKQGDIAILRTLGASPASITTIFMIQGTIIGFVGTLLGLGLGLLLASNLGSIIGAVERLVGGQFLPADLYFISGFPTDIQSSDVVGVVIVSIVLAFLATIYPSYRAARVNPAEVLRYE